MICDGKSTNDPKDSGLHTATFWDYKDHQDRVVYLWMAIAKYYANNTWVSMHLRQHQAGELMILDCGLQSNERASIS